MLYSPEFYESNESNECNCPEPGSPSDGYRPKDVESPNPSDAGGGVGSLGRSSWEFWGLAMQKAAIQLAGNQIFGAKEADSIGMTRGYPWLVSGLFGWTRRAGLAALLVLPAILALAPRAVAQSASTWNKRGQTAELHQDYDTAYEDYLKAHQKSPKDLRYQTRVDRMRFQAAAAHVDRGRVLRQGGDLSGALNQFTRALQIDPSNEAATQEIQITQRMDKTGGAAAVALPGTAESRAAQRDIAGIAAPLELKPLSADPITLHMVETPKNLYLAVGKLAGLNVIFDPDLDTASGATKRIPVDLSDVSLLDALRIVGMETSTFYKPVTKDTIFVAQNTKHATLDDLAIQTFYLTNPSQASDANEIQTAIRNVLPTDAKIFLIPSQNALVVRATPDQLTLVQKLINDLDRTKAEVVVDVAILEVNRDTVKNLGITLPQSFGLTPQASSTSTTTTTTTSTTSPSSFTLNTLANTNATNFAVTIGGGTLNALYTDADTRVLQNPSIRATDGQQATMKIGSKIPVATGSYSAGAATGITAGIGVQTQFTYLDVGVNIDMTPTIHMDREVSLKLNVEVLSQTGSVTISGVTEPIIGQRSDKAVIQLRDGEPCLLAGLLEDSYTYNNTGTPGLSQIPIIKYLFGTIDKEITKDEIVFVLIPHIVRESVLTNLNTRAIDTGTSATIELRHAAANPADDLAPVGAGPAVPAQTTTAANAAAGMVQQLKQQAMPPMPPLPGGMAANAGGAQAPTAVPTGPPVAFTVLPVNSTQAVGSTFAVSVVATNAHDVFDVPLQVQFDSKVLELVNVDTGGLLGGDGQPVALVHRDEGNGMVTIRASRPPNVKGVDGQGEVCILTFKAIATGDSNIALVKVGAKNSVGVTLPAVGSQAAVHVK